MAKKPAKKAVAKKKKAPAKKKPLAKKTAARKPATKKLPAKKPTAAAAFDWDRASQGSLSNGGKLLSTLVEGKPAAQQNAYGELASKVVGRPVACVVAPFLVDLAIAGGARVECLRLLAAIRERMPSPDMRSAVRLARATDPITPHVPGFLRDADAAVRAAGALVAAAFATAKPELATALAVETDPRAKTCMILALDDVATAQGLLADPDARIVTAAACVLARPDTAIDDRVLALLERALTDATLDTFPIPDHSLRASALARIETLNQPALRDRLATVYIGMLDSPSGGVAALALMKLVFTGHEAGAPLSDLQTTALRQLVQSTTASHMLFHHAQTFKLPHEPSSLRRLAGIREPVPEGWVLGVELTVDGVTDTAYGFWLTHDQTGVGNPRVIASAIADALSPAACAEAILEGGQINSRIYYDHGFTPPPLPPGGVLGARKGWEIWTIYKSSNTEVADAYEKQLVGDGWHMLGRCDQPDDLRLLAIRDGVIVEGTFYWEAENGATVLVEANPDLLTTFVDAAIARHGTTFVDAYVAIVKTMSTPAGKKRIQAFGNIGYNLPQAALLIAQRTGSPPDPAFDDLVVQHQGNANVLLPGHIAYLWLVPASRRKAMVDALGTAGKSQQLATALKATAVN